MKGNNPSPASRRRKEAAPPRPASLRRRPPTWSTATVACLLALTLAHADSVAPKAADNSVDAELASFQVAEGYEISLFASEQDGIANPIAMRWDSRGRLWVMCSLVYPQIIPTHQANDKLFILEDTDHDGRADETKVFVDGLDMPTGFALGEGGVFVGEGQNLVFFKDTDGDDKADEREEVLSGFGTEDTHQNINSFAWSPGGELFFCQGLHGFGRVETPWGIVRLDEHGVWRLRPRRLQLHTFRGGSSQNPWGIAHGAWGEPFVKGGSGTTLSELLPIMVHTDHYHPPVDIGATQIKSMIVEIVDSPALPADLQGNMLIAGYFAHLIDRMRPEPDGAGHKTENLPPLVRSSHRSFRPVDLQTGPDGAIYVADWFNPIIGHYQASLRHPDRDKEHGRIWRITARGLSPVSSIDLTPLSAANLMRRLPEAPLRERERIRIELSNRDTSGVLKALKEWTDGLLQAEPTQERALFEALCLYEWNETVHETLLKKMFSSESPRVRAYATRVVGRWHDRLQAPLAWLEAAVIDPHPRVRLEAVVASSYVTVPEAMTTAARALDLPVDRFIQAGLVQATHALQPRWLPALLKGEITFKTPEHLVFVLNQTSGGHAADAARALLREQTLSAEASSTLMSLLALQGDVSDLDWVFHHGRHDTNVLAALADAAAFLGKRPSGDLETPLRQILIGWPSLQAPAAFRLAEVWNLVSLAPLAEQSATNTAWPGSIRSAAVDTLASLQQTAALPVLTRLAREDPLASVRHAAIENICRLNLDTAATVAAARLAIATDASDVQGLVLPFARQTLGPQALAKSLSATPLDPDRIVQIRNIFGTAGRHSEALDQLLTASDDTPHVGLPDYSDAFVQGLSQEIAAEGNATRGAHIYANPALSCTGCHRIGEQGGIFGPELTAVGAGLPVELIIEAVLWPARQVKEGYLATTLNLRDGETVSGYVQKHDAGHIVIRDIATGELRKVATSTVQSRQDAGTVMPPGLTAGLSREELRDLIKYLSERRPL